MGQTYNNPAGGSPSTIGSQIRTDFYQKKALTELKKEQYFSPLADVTKMPKNFGKKIKVFHYMPLLDDRNINDQGIDAAGATIATANYFVSFPQLVLAYATDTLATNAAASINAGIAGAAVKTGTTNPVTGVVGAPWIVTANAVITTNALKTTATASLNANINSATNTAQTVAVACSDSGAPGTTMAFIALSDMNVKYATTTTATAVTTAFPGAVSQQGSGNLYGSSKDIGTISGKMPALSESGGRVNRVGFKRIELEGTLEKFGIFEEYTNESVVFDTDEELEMHIHTEMLNGANELTEDALQIDLLTTASSAGVVLYSSNTVLDNLNMTGVTANTPCEVRYEDFSRLSIMLDENRTPKHTKVVTGSRMVDTRTIPAARVMYIGSELVPTLEQMQTTFNTPAFIPVQQYASAGEVLNGEIGIVGQFRIVVVPEMMHWAGVGAPEGVNGGYRVTNGRYNVYPMLVVGEGSFTTIGFYTDGKSAKFQIFNKKPGLDTVDKTDPFGESGLMSIKWYYGFMALRPERLGLIKTVARR